MAELAPGGHRPTRGSSPTSERRPWTTHLTDVAVSAPAAIARSGTANGARSSHARAEAASASAQASCHEPECGRELQGFASVRYTEGNPAVPNGPVFSRFVRRDRRNGRGL